MSQDFIIEYHSSESLQQMQERMLAYIKHWSAYTIMHGNQKVVTIYKDGTYNIHSDEMMPYNLYLEPIKEEDMEIRLQNLDNFYYWCASRVLTLDREYAKEILNSIGATQATTDRDRAKVALTYHCLSLTDIYWAKESKESVDFDKINLFTNHLEKAFVDVTLRGKQLTIQNSHLIADDLGTQGCYPKAWIRKDNTFWLMKDGGMDVVENELLASKICRCFDVNQVRYEEDYYDGQKVSISRIITSLDESIVSMEHFNVYAMNHSINKMEYILRLDAYSYYMMNIMDYLLGNTDRHWGNWGVLIDNKTNKPIRLYDLMDFNKSFHSYDQIEGANCLTIENTEKKQTQKEAAIEAVCKVGLNQVCEVSPHWFKNLEQKEMFFERLELLKGYCKDA